MVSKKYLPGFNADTAVITTGQVLASTVCVVLAVPVVILGYLALGLDKLTKKLEEAKSGKEEGTDFEPAYKFIELILSVSGITKAVSRLKPSPKKVQPSSDKDEVSLEEPSKVVETVDSEPESTK